MASRDLNDLHPDLKALCEQFLSNCLQENIGAHVDCTYRSMEEQAHDYSQGRTTSGKIITNAKPGQSKHNFTINDLPAAKAFDIYIVDVNNILNWDTSTPEWKRVGEIGRELGLIWGGDFNSIKDYPHFELKE